MKQQHTHHSLPTCTALLFFAAMTLIGVATAHAQDTVNPLVSTTGPNVLGSGHIQWNTTLQWDHLKYFTQEDILGANTGFRFGVGNRAELTLDVKASHYSFIPFSQNQNHVQADSNNLPTADNFTTVAPSVGARLLLYEGKGWLPKVAFNTSVALASVSGRDWAADETLVQPTIGLSFRNDLGKGWMLDYALNFTWNSHYPAQNYPPASLSVFARWLATDRLMLGAGFTTASWSEVFRGTFEVRYLATPDLQLSLQGGMSGIESLGVWNGSISITTHLMAGVSWTLR